jgi:hypothetical protein
MMLDVVNQSGGTGPMQLPDASAPPAGGYLLGAYPAAPHDPAQRRRFYARLARLPEVAGLEVPFGHPSASVRDRHAIPEEPAPHWRFVLTALPATVALTEADPGFGLASPDEAGRRAAVDFTRRLCAEVHALVRRHGPHSVPAVFLHSAPRGGQRAAFVRSLAEIASWDWAGATPVVEHCDTPRPGHAPAKGYLPLGEELRALDEVGHPSPAVAVNWGRSALEERSADGPVRHLRAAAAAGRLAGLIFSGCAGEPGPYGAAWADAHLPVATDGDDSHHSLLTASRARTALAAAPGVWLLAAKFAHRPTTSGVTERIAGLRASLRALPRPPAVHRPVRP